MATQKETRYVFMHRGNFIYIGQANTHGGLKEYVKATDTIFNATHVSERELARTTKFVQRELNTLIEVVKIEVETTITFKE